MSIFLIIIAVVAGIVILFLLVAAVAKSSYSVERSIIINQPAQVIFDYIKYLKNQDNYSFWAKIDPAMRKGYSGTDGTPGFKATWDSDNKKAGKGEQTINAVVDGRQVDTEIHFIKPFEGLAQASMVTKPITDSRTEVIWAFKSKMPYPMNIMLLFMDMDKMIGKDLQHGLDNLKDILEQ